MPTKESPSDISTYPSNALPPSTIPELHSRKITEALKKRRRESFDYRIGEYPKEDFAEIDRVVSNALLERKPIRLDFDKYTPEARIHAVKSLAMSVLGVSPDEKSPEFNGIIDLLRPLVHSAKSEKPQPIRIDLGTGPWQAAYSRKIAREGTPTEKLQRIIDSSQREMLKGTPSRVGWNKFLPPLSPSVRKPGRLSAAGAAVGYGVRDLQESFVSPLAIPDALVRHPLVRKGIGIAAKPLTGPAGRILSRIASIRTNRPGLQWTRDWVKNAGGEIPETVGALFNPRYGKPKGTFEHKLMADVRAQNLTGSALEAADAIMGASPRDRKVAEYLARKGLLDLEGVAGTRLSSIQKIMQGRGSDIGKAVAVAGKVQRAEVERGLALINASRFAGDKKTVGMIEKKLGKYGAKNIYFDKKVRGEKLPSDFRKLGVSDGLGSTIQARGYPPAGQEKLDWLTRVATGGVEQSRLVALKEAMNRMSQNPDIFRKARENVRIPEGAIPKEIRGLFGKSNRYGDVIKNVDIPAPRGWTFTGNDKEATGLLTGGYMPEQAYNQLQGMSSVFRNPQSKLARDYMRIFKAASVSMSPSAVIDNQMSNMSAQLLAESNPLKVISGNVGAAKEILGRGKHYEKFKELGLYSSLPEIDEVSGEISRILDMRNKAKELGVPFDLDKAIRGAVGGDSQFIKKGNQLYQFLENLGKTSVALNEFNRTGDYASAVAKGHKYLYNYNDITDFMRVIRSNPILGSPFITYPMKSLAMLPRELARKGPGAVSRLMTPFNVAQQYAVNRDQIDLRDMQRQREAEARLHEQQGKDVPALMARVMPRTQVGAGEGGGVRWIDPLRKSILGGMASSRGYPVDVGGPGATLIRSLIDATGRIAKAGKTPEILPDVARTEVQMATGERAPSVLRSVAPAVGALAGGTGPVAGLSAVMASPIPWQALKVLSAQSPSAAQYIDPQAMPSPRDYKLPRTTGEAINEWLFKVQRGVSPEMLEAQEGINLRSAGSQRKKTLRDIATRFSGGVGIPSGSSSE